MLLTSRPNEEKEAILDVLRIFAHFGRNRQLKQIINSNGNRLVKTSIGCWIFVSMFSFELMENYSKDQVLRFK